jgi:hypothetical protein
MPGRKSPISQFFKKTFEPNLVPAKLKPLCPGWSNALLFLKQKYNYIRATAKLICQLPEIIVKQMQIMLKSIYFKSRTGATGQAHFEIL